ncbi:predicted protein [Histoplasma capsulatum var. duboisii H88]|uniref:Predicted protein n=2 Tax=Ajellomyces capsulatus TaxID=5037 RepID=F0U6S0_AJEC8|nr:predicted protein [Histoplasma capsulatum H143]EGC41499.1 predicted protein [Histoplasma capsulatum var. duboisii H88]
MISAQRSVYTQWKQGVKLVLAPVRQNWVALRTYSRFFLASRTVEGCGV